MMARYIHCEACKDKMKAAADKYGELYEYLEGTAQHNMFCDLCSTNGEATLIKRGDKCVAAVLLNNRNHPNYEKQKPEMWAGNLLQITFNPLT